jgi:hypothetical protein
LTNTGKHGCLSKPTTAKPEIFYILESQPWGELFLASSYQIQTKLAEKSLMGLDFFMPL